MLSSTTIINFGDLGRQVPTGFEQANQWARAARGEDVSDADLDAIDADDDLPLPQLGNQPESGQSLPEV